MLRQYIDLSCQDDEPDAGARELLGGKPGPRLPKTRIGGGTSPLHLASCRGHVGVVHELLLAGADATRGDQFGFSALHLAARHGFPEVITELLTHSKISVDLLDNSGETALHTAARYAKTLCVARLLEFGCDLTISSKYGRRAIDVIGQAQDKHNRFSLPHSTTQLAGGGKLKNNRNMPLPQGPRDRCSEERLRRLLIAASRDHKDGWCWPKDDGPVAGSTVTAGLSRLTLSDDHQIGDSCRSSPVPVDANIAADGGGAGEDTEGTRVDEGVILAVGVKEDNRPVATCVSSRDAPEKHPLRRLNLRGLVKGRVRDATVVKALNRYVSRDAAIKPATSSCGR